jgi:hypothetical protein
MVFFQDRFCSAAVGQWGDVTPLALLAQQFMNEGFGNTK